ncbi:hypothetical protein [Yokenella regensburgei]|uniref:hypothetical protein n=1 Tax=Yokenella regensburgei TaxID=158877 RepID=UPI0014333F06|nr:hypothetical protein [Yokenella regensburgei]QIU89378.1 hypothetical protein HEC60_08645 [Yokenella regensburgei]
MNQAAIHCPITANASDAIHQRFALRDIAKLLENARLLDEISPNAETAARNKKTEEALKAAS